MFCLCHGNKSIYGFLEHGIVVKGTLTPTGFMVFSAYLPDWCLVVPQFDILATKMKVSSKICLALAALLCLLSHCYGQGNYKPLNLGQYRGFLN